MRNLASRRGFRLFRFVRGAAPTQGTLKMSPGRFAGPDHGWTLMTMTSALYPHCEEIAKIPNKPSKIDRGLIFMILPESRP
jgi:hypothetical protein